MQFGGHGSLSVELFKVKKYLKTRKILKTLLKVTTKPAILENFKRSAMWGHWIWRAQKSTNPELYINTVYLLLRDAKLLEGFHYYKLKINISSGGCQPLSEDSILAILRFLLPYALIIDWFLIFKEQRSFKQSHIHFPCRSNILLQCSPTTKVDREMRHLVSRAEDYRTTLVSSPPRSPPSEGFHLSRPSSFGLSRNAEGTRDKALRAFTGLAGRLGMLLAQHDKLSRKPADQCTPIMGVLPSGYIIAWIDSELRAGAPNEDIVQNHLT